MISMENNAESMSSIYENSSVLNKNNTTEVQSELRQRLSTNCSTDAPTCSHIQADHCERMHVSVLRRCRMKTHISDSASLIETVEHFFKNCLICCPFYASDVAKFKPKFRRKLSHNLTNIFVFIISFIVCLVPIAAVSKDGSPPRTFASNVIPMSGLRGKTIFLSCSVEGNPRPETVWWKDGERMSRDWKRFKQQHARLRIRKAELSDSGLYQCQAINGYGTGQMIHIQLQIHDQASTGSPKRKESVKPIFSQPVKMRRHSYIKPQGGTVNFPCKAKGKPRPRIQWFKDGNRTEIKGSGGSRSQWTLTLRNIGAGDSGIYTCRVWNSAGYISFDYTLRVVGNHHERPVLLKPHPVNTTVTEGGKTSLQCKVRSDLPPTVKWIKRISPESLRTYNGELPNDTLQIEDNYYMFLPSQEMIVLPDGTYLNKLVINRARLVDSGIYICLGANTMGYTFRFAYLTVNPASDLTYNDRLSTEKQLLPIAAIIAAPAAVGVIIVCIITIYCANNRDRFVRCSNPQPVSPRDRTKVDYSGASRFSSSSSTSSRNMEVVVDTHTVKNQTTPPEVSLTPPPTISDDPPEELIPSVSYPQFTSDLTESELASAYVPPPPPPPSQHSRASSWTTSSRHSRSHHSCSHHHHHHHSSRRDNLPPRSDSHGSYCSHHHHHSIVKQSSP